MGKLVAFWSPFVGQSKVTASMCAVAGAMGLLYPEVELALSHTQPEAMELEACLDYRLDTNRKKELYEKTGLAALQLNYMQAVLTPDKIRRCAIPLLMKSVYLFPGSGKTEGLESVRFQILTKNLVEEFDVTFLDLASGWMEDSMQFMQEADVVVVVLPQKPACWDELFEKAEWLEKKKVCLLIGGYLKHSKYSQNYFRRKKAVYNKGSFIGTVPLNAGFMDAMTEGKCLEFFLKNELVEKKEENYEFITQTKRIAEYLKTELLLS